jgi:enamine deaminase RidA (YjgF/YER057c/UK114 family)
MGIEMGMIDQRLVSLGISLPPAPAPGADYVPWLISGSLLFISGQIARDENGLISGQVAGDQDVERGQYAARACGLALLSQAGKATGGHLDRIARVIRIGGFVNAAPDFTKHAAILDGCSKLMIDVFLDKGRHVRAAVGCSSLPRGVMVEAEAIFELSR